MQVTLTGKAVRFTGQDISGWEIEHLSVDDAGLPVRQARQKFPGGEQIAQQGDYIVTLDSGQQIIVHALPKEAKGGHADAPAAGDSHDAHAQAAATPTAKAPPPPKEGK